MPLGDFDFTSETSGYRVSNPLIAGGAMPSRAVRPRNIEELIGLVRLARDSGFGLVPVSSAPPHCKGGTICNAPHIIVDLSRWVNCDTIDRRNRVCRIEPGVTYGELLTAIEPLGMTVSMPLAPRSGKSVLAAAMDREPSTWPNKQWDISDPVCSTEFIFGSGDIFRTGAAAGPGSLEKQRAVGGAQKSPMGPSQTDFHRVLQGAQGSMGIVTWITIRAEIKPTVEEPRVIGAEDVAKLIPFIYDVQRPWLGEHSFILNRTALAMLVGEDAEATGKLQKAFPRFVCLQNIAGFDRMPGERVDYQLQDIGEIARRRGLNLDTFAGPVTARELLRIATRPCGARDWRHRRKGHCLSVFFLTTLDRVPRFIGLFNEVAAGRKIEEENLGIYVQPVVQNHACHIEFMVPMNPLDFAETGPMAMLMEEVVNKLADGGAFFSRPYGAAVGAAFMRNAQNMDVLKKIKTIFDPASIMNPGKFGFV